MLHPGKRGVKGSPGNPNAWEYRWSSARHHVKSIPDVLVGESPWLEAQRRDAYREYLSQIDDDEEMERIRRSARTGRPFGDADFTAGLEQKLGRLLHPGKRGPKPRS